MTRDTTEPESDTQLRQNGRSPKPLIIAVAILLGLFTMYMALGMPGMDHSTPGENPSHDMDDMVP